MMEESFAHEVQYNVVLVQTEPGLQLITSRIQTWIDSGFLN